MATRARRSTRRHGTGSNSESRKIRCAVIGLGYIAQIAVLPAFKHAKRNSELAALVSVDHEKLRVLGRRYRVKHLYTYDQVDELFASGLRRDERRGQAEAREAHGCVPSAFRASEPRKPRFAR